MCALVHLQVLTDKRTLGADGQIKSGLAFIQMKERGFCECEK
jgi:hypothetical protein